MLCDGPRVETIGVWHTICALYENEAMFLSLLFALACLVQNPDAATSESLKAVKAQALKDSSSFQFLRELSDEPWKLPPPDKSTFLAAAATAHGAAAVICPDPRPGIALPHTGPISFLRQSAAVAFLDIAKGQEELSGTLPQERIIVPARAEKTAEALADQRTAL